MPKLPTGFVPRTSEELHPSGEFDPRSLKNLDCIPCRLYTDRYGTNYFVINHEGEEYFLPLRTD